MCVFEDNHEFEKTSQSGNGFSHMQIYKFRNCYLNTIERRVVRDGKYLDLSPKAYDVLQLLVENFGEIVTKDEILGKVWNGSFVEEGNLPVHISKLRRLLGDTKTERFIETVQGNGYRFAALVESVNGDTWRKSVRGENRLQKNRRSTDFRFDSIAVLPLDNESSNPEMDYVADGLTESFINSLSHVPHLKVMARNTVFRYKNKDVDAKEVGETLGVSAVLTGRIRVMKDSLMVSVELINVEDGSQLWGTQYSRQFSDIITIYEEITFAVSEKLRSGTGLAFRNPPQGFTQNSESYRLYLKGKYFSEKRTVDDLYRAIECFEKSVSYDPKNVYSYVEMAQCYHLLYVFDYISYTDCLIKTKPILAIVSEQNQSIDVVQVMYGDLKLVLEWKFEEASQHIRRALAINPNCLVAHLRFSEFLMRSGKFTAALEHLTQMTIIDPFSVLTYIRIGRLFYLMERYENAIIYLKDALELEPANFEALALTGGVLTEMGNLTEALAIFQKSLSTQFNVDVLARIGVVFGLQGQEEKAHQIIKEIESKSSTDSQYSIKLARIYLALGEREKAYEFLERAFREHEMELVTLKFDPRWASIRDEPRFRELIRRVGLSVD